MSPRVKYLCSSANAATNSDRVMIGLLQTMLSAADFCAGQQNVNLHRLDKSLIYQRQP
jgi:hypothetical protein